MIHKNVFCLVVHSETPKNVVDMQLFFFSFFYHDFLLISSTCKCEKKKIEIFEVSVAEITIDFLDVIKSHRLKSFQQKTSNALLFFVYDGS